MFQRKNQDVLSEHYHKLVNFDDENGSDEEEDFMTVQRVNHELSGDEEEGSGAEQDIKVCCVTHASIIIDRCLDRIWRQRTNPSANKR